MKNKDLQIVSDVWYANFDNCESEIVIITLNEKEVRHILLLMAKLEELQKLENRIHYIAQLDNSGEFYKGAEDGLKNEVGYAEYVIYNQPVDAEKLVPMNISSCTMRVYCDSVCWTSLEGDNPIESKFIDRSSFEEYIKECESLESPEEYLERTHKLQE